MKNAAVAAVIAALVSASGTYAASRVLITSTKQIAPPVLAQLAKLKARTSYVQGPAGPTGSAGSSITGPPGKDGATGAASTLPGERGLPGSEGRQGSAGPEGARGPAGESIVGPAGELKNVTQYEQTSIDLGYKGGSASTVAECPPGDLVVGGGFTSDNPYVFAYASRATATGWEVGATNTNGNEVGQITVYALCAK